VEPSSADSPFPAERFHSGVLLNTPLTGVVHRYQSKGWWYRIDVEFNESEVSWSFRGQSSQWRERLPLATLVPYPSATTDHRTARNTLICFLVACIGAVFLAWLDSSRMEFSPGTILCCICACFCAVHAGWCWWRGPLEWATFSSHFPGKTIYYFQTAPGDAFSAFTDRLQEAILAATHSAVDSISRADKDRSGLG
jgi:hypothetical protein